MCSLQALAAGQRSVEVDRIGCPQLERWLRWCEPYCEPEEDSSGSLYGTTQWGGSGGYGIAFRFVPPPSGQTGWTEYVLHALTGGADGADPSSGILLGHAAVYGTTAGGGTQKAGVAYVLWAPASGSI